ncbi:hypothetical protein JX265_004243 [Neoarthrinium moseri]|uniref:Clr5 domain-containing protein n=1 Tax=Neoarthrinium moseri TaxID=1658444 RepID=A0A9Q0ANK0_9PEZI|nr:hypothetical protein JX265_004243 [Neoarthrinium moseri]
MTPAPAGKAWASPEDWEANKETISRLWWDDDHSLKEVQDIMSQEHDFHATDKMYKSRLKSWGLVKNLKSSDAKQIMGLAQSGVVKQPLVIRGRSMGSKKWQKRLNRVASRPETTTKVLVSTRNGAILSPPVTVASPVSALSPLSGRVEPPDTLRITEAGLMAVHDFAVHQFEETKWDLSGLTFDFDADKTDSWYNGLSLATRNLLKDRNSPTNFAMVHKSFDQYSAVLDQATPSLIPLTLGHIVGLMEVGPEMAATLLRYVARLVAIKFGESHPLSRFWAQMQTLGPVQIQQVIGAVLGAYFHVIVNHSHPANRWRTAMYPTYAKLQQKWGAISEQAAVTIFERTIREIENSIAGKRGKTTKAADHDEIIRHLYEVKIYFAIYLVERKRFPEAYQVTEEIGSWLERGGATQFPEQYEQWLLVRGSTLVGLGKLEEATPYYLETYQARRKRLGVENSRTTRAMLQLEEHYSRLGQPLAAEKMHSELEQSWIKKS